MKKNYIKPIILFEDFTRSTNLSTACEIKVNTQEQFSCGIQFEGSGDFDLGFSFTIFTDEAAGICNMEPSGELDQVCYHVPYEDNNLFNS